MDFELVHNSADYLGLLLEDHHTVVFTWVSKSIWLFMDTRLVRIGLTDTLGKCPAFRVSYMYLLPVLIGLLPSVCVPFDWISLILTLRHSIENHCIVLNYLFIEGSFWHDLSICLMGDR